MYLGALITHGTRSAAPREEVAHRHGGQPSCGHPRSSLPRDDLPRRQTLRAAIIASHEFETEGLAVAIERMLSPARRPPGVPLCRYRRILDPAHAPGTGTRRPEGMTSRELFAMICALRSVNLVGAGHSSRSPLAPPS
jgi:agmatinase